MSAIKRFVSLFLVVIVACAGILVKSSCSYEDLLHKKASPLLLAQIELRKKQTADPSPERLEQMKAFGMRLDNLEMQRTFLYLKQELTTSQVAELQALGIILYLDSWIPPVSPYSAGFVTADVPIDKFADLARKEYVVKLDTAEQLLEPQPMR